MNKHEQTRRAPSQKAARKPYQKPAFEREQIFETMALACGKTTTSSSHSCHSLPKHS